MSHRSTLEYVAVHYVVDNASIDHGHEERERERRGVKVRRRGRDME